MTTSGSGAANSPEDELLSRLYQQITERRAAGFAAGYDIAAGLDRYRAWLGKHTEEEHRLQAPQLQGAMAGRDAAQVVTALYSAHYDSMVTLAASVVGDVSTAKEIVQDSFEALRKNYRRLPDNDKTLSLLGHSVLDRSRSVLQHRADAQAARDLTAAVQGALASLDRAAVIAALASLPEPQRDALGLCYLMELPYDQIASTMGISTQEAMSHVEQAIASLRALREMET
jgi:RNA polymerase sigma factor (sigma-70 family)